LISLCNQVNKLKYVCFLLLLQIIVFDLEYGQPAAATSLPASRAPLDDLLGCYGHAGSLCIGVECPGWIGCRQVAGWPAW
jgi:hypothetical protein